MAGAIGEVNAASLAQMAGAIGEVNAANHQDTESRYDMVCLGVSNQSGTCYLSVAILSILTMDATRRAFMNLPDPDSPDYTIPDDTMTGTINLFFLQRRRPKRADYRLKRMPRLTQKHLTRIENWFHQVYPGFPGQGGLETHALHFILTKIIEEGYLKGLEEDLFGKYYTRATCKTCSFEDVKNLNEIMATVYLFITEEAEIFRYLERHAAEGKEFELQKNLDNRTVYLSIRLLFKFLYLLPPSVIETQSLERASQIMNPTFRSSCCYPLHERRYGTTFTHFPRTLIVDMNFLPKKWKEKIIVDEFIDLSQLAESQTTPTMNAKYKLVAVGKDMPEHTFIYVTACKFKNHIYCEQFSSRNIYKGSRWYKVDNTDILELVPVSEVLRGTKNKFLIYEQEREPDPDPEPEQQQFRIFFNKIKKKKEKRLPRSRR